MRIEQKNQNLSRATRGERSRTKPKDEKSKIVEWRKGIRAYEHKAEGTKKNS